MAGETLEGAYVIKQLAQAIPVWEARGLLGSHELPLLRMLCRVIVEEDILQRFLLTLTECLTAGVMLTVFGVTGGVADLDTDGDDIADNREILQRRLQRLGHQVRSAESGRQALEMTQGNQTRAAEALGLTRDALRYRMKKFGFLE